MLKEAIEKILSLAPPSRMEVDGRIYADRKLERVEPPTAPAVQLKSLDAMIDFLKWERPLDLDTLIAEIEGPMCVTVFGHPSPVWRRREEVVTATFGEATVFPFDRFVDQETFIIGLQVGFVQDFTTGDLLKLVGTIEDRKVGTVADDGLHQVVTASVGIARLGNVEVPNPVTLRPFRTFAEIDQPESRYVVRMKSGAAEGSLPSIALFAVEDPTWQRVARQSIAAYLRDHLEGLVVLA